MRDADHERRDTLPSGQSNQVHGGFATTPAPSEDEIDEQSEQQGA